MMNAFTEHSVDSNGIRMHWVEQGSGPVVLLCHGFPEFWYSFRHQLPALAAAGYRAIAPDLRGYGQTEQPPAIDQYTLLHLVGDLLGLLDALDVQSAVIVGHDWGAIVAWHAALLRPDRFRAVVGLSVPFRARSAAPPTRSMPQTDRHIFYQLYFQAPGVAEADFESSARRSLRTLFAISSGAAKSSGADGVSPAPPRFNGMLPRTGLFTSGAPEPPLPAWLTEADLDLYAAEFERSGFAGAFNWYRNMDRNWELLAPFKGARIRVPALYVVGEQDMVLGLPGIDRNIADLPTWVPEIRPPVVLPGCGHWTQQERPNEVNQALLEFLRSLVAAT